MVQFFKHFFWEIFQVGLTSKVLLTGTKRRFSEKYFRENSRAPRIILIVFNRPRKAITAAEIEAINVCHKGPLGERHTAKVALEYFKVYLRKLWGTFMKPRIKAFKGIARNMYSLCLWQRVLHSGRAHHKGAKTGEVVGLTPVWYWAFY